MSRCKVSEPTSVGCQPHGWLTEDSKRVLLR
nr:MAG TPA: hypothetical protein [Caudoviricetes sp.]